MAANNEILLNPPTVGLKENTAVSKAGIKYIDYKDPEFLKRFLNEQGKILPAGFWYFTKYQRSGPGRQTCPPPGLLPYVTDLLK